MHGLITAPADQERIASGMHREARAYAVIDAIMNCDREDRLPFLEAILDGLRAGMPPAPFGHVMDEANFWADWASRAERKAYCAACFARLSPADQSAFRTFISEKVAA